MHPNPPPRRNRGKSSEDEPLFAPAEQQAKLQQALADMHYLLSRDYFVKASLALVGNRYRLQSRQLLALQGMSASQQDIELRKRKEISIGQLKEKTLYLDGFNVLILLETLLSGGYIFKGLDGCYRDISSVHGTYKKVNQTEDVLLLVGQTLQKLEVQRVVWIFDTPVSNSGRLKTLCYEIAEKYGFVWDIFLENSPDKYLVEDNRLVSSSDAWVLNECSQWFNMGAYVIHDLVEKRDNVIEFTVLP